MEGEEFDQLVRFFDGMAMTSWLSSVHDQLQTATGSWENLSVLDIGCGTGRFLLRGASVANKVTGIDLSNEMIKASEQLFLRNDLQGKADFLVGDACELPFCEGMFDLTISTCLLFLLPEPQVGLKEMLRVTKKNGTIAMLNPALGMDQQQAEKYCKTHNITGFEYTTFLQWATVSTKRHRYSTEALTDYLLKQGAKDVFHEQVLDGLAIITVAKL